ncbi:ABC transporter ATP-binding protein [Streptomyces sp. HNM0575]|uniref:ABC transporter transmembrane domain-containing protein n=1 Tax=Streptomyces sp. HNM0575 TaxID=2716338 RepID=UPI00145C3BBE|nr:ABC transporter ATP-binding protein [Streptomyces sp. HNM0575]NLU73257.1 ABC transporter ATP-binding protein [Streptomyces sp. HNM0575]
MQIRDLPYPDPGVPDVRSGPRFLLWLFRMQVTGQAKSLGWGAMHMGSVALVPAVVGLALKAVVAGSGRGLLEAGALLAVIAVTVTTGDTMTHRTSITNWITAAARVQQLLARRTAALGATLTQRVAAGEVVAVSTGDIEKIGWCVESASRFSAALVTTVGVCVGLVFYEPQLGVLVSAGMVVLAVTVLPLLPRATRRADLQREKAGRATELAADTVAGLRVLRGIGGEELFLTRYRRASQEVRRAAVRTARMWALIEAVQVALPGLLLVAVVWHGTRLALDGRIGVGELVTVYGAVTFLLFPLRLFQEFAMAYSFSRPSARRAVRVLGLRRGSGDAGVEARGEAEDQGGVEGEAGDEGTAGATGVAGEGAGTAAEPPGTGDMLCRDLYDPVTGLLAPAGQLTAVVCGDPEAAGRLADRLGGHAPEHDGSASVLLGGMPLDDMPLASARSAVLVQDKDPVLLSGTLRELLDVPGSGAVPDERALEAAQCGDVLDALKQASPGASDGDPLDASVTERGRSLSGGQRQRLALARSLVADPPVLVLDEPTSAVDAHTEARIARSLRRVREGRTTVVFTSSPLMLDQAERVALVRGSEVLAAGPHRELLRTHAGYRSVVTRETEQIEPAEQTGQTGEPGGAAEGRGAGAGVGTAAEASDAAAGAAGAAGSGGAGSGAATAPGHSPVLEGRTKLAQREGAERT